jgi:hypothetical protein
MKGHTCRRAGVGATLIAAVLQAGCTSDEATGTPDVDPPRATTTVASPFTFEDLLTDRDCVEAPPGDTQIGPMRGGGPAARWAICNLSDTVVHVFERAPLENNAGLDSLTGSIENIRRLFGVGTVTPGCDITLTITENFVVVTPTGFDLGPLADDLGPPEEPPVAASPTVSYLPPDCTLWDGSQPWLD